MSRVRAGRRLALAAAALLWACSEPTAPPPEPLPPGDGLPVQIETMIFGSSTPCRDDATCASGVCTYGACIGVLLADQRWMHDRVAKRLLAEVERRSELRPRVLTQLSRVARSVEADNAYRSRALRTLEALGAAETLTPLLADPEPRISEEAALGLTRLGDPAGQEVALELAQSERIATSAEALRALGSLPGDASLRALLSSLNPALDPALVRASIDGLTALGDARAVRPLAEALETLPGHLRQRATDALRSLTKARLGSEASTWKRWVEEHSPPQPPEVQLRAPQTHDEEGLPAPY